MIHLTDYLACSCYVNFDHPDVLAKAKELGAQAGSDVGLAKRCYLFVRDCIPHAWDVRDPRVSVSASDVLKNGTGICWAKSNLLAALLRFNGIPSGFSYQRLTLGDTSEQGWCIHGLNTVFLPSLNRWIRLDARGNTGNVHAAFSLNEEQLAFPIRPEYDEIDYHDNRDAPSEKLMQILRSSQNTLELYQYGLPDSLE